MPKQWWSSRSGFVAQGSCLLALFAWSVHHSPAETRQSAPPRATAPPPAANVRVDPAAETASTGSTGPSSARFIAPPPIRFRTEHPPAGSLNLRPLERPLSAPWQPLHPQNPPQRLPSGPRSPFDLNRSGATVYNAPPQDAD